MGDAYGSEAIRRAAENALRTLNSPAVKAALESQRRNQDLIAKAAARSVLSETHRQIAASIAFRDAQNRILQKVLASSVAWSSATKRAAQTASARHLSTNTTHAAAVRALERWSEQNDVSTALDRLVESAKARETSSVDLDADQQDVETLAVAPAPADNDLLEFESALELDPETDAAVDAAASHLMVTFPTLTRAHARLLVVVLAYVGSAGALLGLSLVPFLAALPGIFGWDAPAAGEAAGRAFDKVLPPVDEDNPDDRPGDETTEHSGAHE